MFGNIGWQELLVIGVVALIFFGGRLPEAAKNLARAFVQFKREINNAGNPPATPAPPTPPAETPAAAAPSAEAAPPAAPPPSEPSANA